MNQHVAEALDYISAQVSSRPHIALVLGSGLNQLTQNMTATQTIDYADIPHFGKSGAPGHVGSLVFGRMHGKDVVCMQGRLHAYEGYSAAEVVFPIMVLNALGVKTLLMTNAAGAINSSYKVGDLMLICDHINFTAINPLTFGEYDGNPSFVDMSYAYSQRLLSLAIKAATNCQIELQQGVYLGLRGPSFETPAEIRAFRIWGADAVGMSTVLETIAATALGMEICAISMISNMAAGMLDTALCGTDVLEASRKSANKMETLIAAILKLVDEKA